MIAARIGDEAEVAEEENGMASGSIDDDDIHFDRNLFQEIRKVFFGEAGI